MQFSPGSCHFLPLRHKYRPQYLIFLEHTQDTFFPQWDRPSFTPIQIRQNSSSVHIKLCILQIANGIFIQQVGSQRIPDKMRWGTARIDSLTNTYTHTQRH